MKAILIAILSSLLASAAPKSFDLQLKDMQGRRVRLKDLRGKPLLINFWATWCGPCQQEMPLIVEAQKEYGARIAFLAVSLDGADTRSHIPAFIDKHHIVFPVWTGASLDDLERLKLGNAVPVTVFVDAAGQIVARVLGEIRPAELKERLDWLAGSETGPAPQPLQKHLPE